MSQTKPPSPVHPRDFNTSVRSMAETQLPPVFPVTSFLGHPDRHYGSAGLVNQPPIHAPLGASSSRSGPAQAYPILPPLRMHSAATSPQDHAPQAVPISKLLSDSPQAPPRAALPTVQHVSPAVVSPPLPSIMDGRPGLPISQSSTLPQPSSMASNTHHPRSPGSTTKRTGSFAIPMHSPTYVSHSPSSASVGSSYSPIGSRAVVAGNHERVTPQISPSPNLKYTLNMRQQPIAARACGFGERDRRVVDPPPIVDVTLVDKETGADEEETPHVYTTLHCTIVHADTFADASQIEQSRTDMAMTQRLMGTCVASPFPGKDEFGRKGTFFVFPDLSCRSPGKYRFLFRLIVVDPRHLEIGGSTKIQTQIYSEQFEVYSAKEFPGMRASSALLKTLRKQGLNVAVKKGREATKKSIRRPQNDGDDSEDEDEMADEDDIEEEGRDSKKRKRSA